MSATIIEQRLPISVQLLSRLSSYAHIFESVLAIILFWFIPTLGPKMPERQITFRPRPRRSRRYSPSIHSVRSIASTLVDEDMADKEDIELGMDEKVRKFSMLSAPMMKPRSLSLMPFARRMSLPAKRFSEHITTTLSSPFQSPSSSPFQSPNSSPFSSPLHSPSQTPSSEFERNCYFSPLGIHSEHVTFEEPEVMVSMVVEQTEEIDYMAELSNLPIMYFKPIENFTKVKRATRKVKSVLRLRRQS